MGVAIPFTEPGEPDARGPARYLWWLVRRQWPRVLLGSLWGTVWMVGLTVPPVLVSRAIDDGLRGGDQGALAGWAAAVLGSGLVTALVGVLRHRTMSFVRLDASYRTVTVVIRHAVRLGAALPRRISSGEVVNIGSTDVEAITRTMTMCGPGVGAIGAYAVVAVQLFSVSALLAAVVLVGVPLLAVLVGPLLNRLQAVEGEYRERQGALTARAGDIVAGLRVLCGIGGKERFAGRYRDRSADLRAQGYRVGAVTSWIQALTIALPSVFLAVVTWLAARMAVAGSITVGELVAVYGYVAMLVIPVFFLIEGGKDLSRGLVAARRIVRVLSLTPDTVDGAGATVRPPGREASLHDPASGLTVRAGRMVALVAARPAEALAVVDRLGRYADSAATWGGVPLSGLPLAEVRSRILVADNDSHLFAGTLRAMLSTRDGQDPAELDRAVHAAVAEDVVAGLDDGLDSPVEAQGRDLSGGQRQRVRLARALLADPEILVLVEPTSSLDSHTEALVAERLHALRRGRTTVVVGTSPLLLDHADEVAYLVDGRVAAAGGHRDLLETVPGYRELVFRGTEDSDADPAEAVRGAR